MANFIDIKHEAFIRGEKPYVLWFNEQVSTGIYGSQSLLLYGLESAHVELPSDQDIFRLYSEVPLDNLDEDTVDNHLTYSIDYVSDSNKVIQIIIVCKSDTEADYLEDFMINGEEHTIGVQIRGENEILEINLANMGVELPKSITRAIYDGSLEDISNTDFVLLNNKYLELLQNYANTIMNKGSYESLMNSLKWFGYGDLVMMREVWKHNTEDGVKFGDFDLKAILSDEFKKALSVYSKTTYEVLSCLVAKYLWDDGINIIGYGDIQATLSYPVVPGEGGKADPVYSFYREVYWSNGTTEIETINPDSLSFSITNTPMDVTIDTVTDTVTSTIRNTESNQISLGEVTMKVTYDGSTVNVTYEVLQDYVYITYYGEIYVTLSYDVISGMGGSTSPTYTAVQSITWSDGIIESISVDPDSVEFTINSSYETITINSETGVVTQTSDNRSGDILDLGTVEITVASNHRTGTATCEIYQETIYIVNYGSLYVTLSYPNIPSNGGSVAPEYHVYQDVEMSDGTTESIEITDYDRVEFSSVYIDGTGSLNSTTGVVSESSLNHTGSDKVVRTVRITVTKGDEIAEATCDVIQETAYIADYGEISVGLSYPTLGINGGTVEPTYTAHQNITWSDGMTGSIAIEPDSVEFEFISSLDGAEIDSEDGNVTYNERNETEQSRTVAVVQITVTYGDLSASNTANVAQECFMITETSIEGHIGWDIGEELHNNVYDWSMLSMLGGTYPLMAKGLKATVSTNDGSKSYDLSLEDCIIGDVTIRGFSEYIPYEDYIKLNEDNSLTVGCSYDVEYRSASYLSLCVGSVYISWYCEEYDTWIRAVFTFNVYQVTWQTGFFSTNLSLSYPTIPAEGGSFMPDYDISVVYDDYSNTHDDRNYRVITMEELEEHDQIEDLKFIKRSVTDQIQEATVNSETGELYVPENTTDEERYVYTELDATVMGRLRVTEYKVTQEKGDAAYEYGAVIVRLSYDTALAKNTTLSPILSYTQTRTGSNGSTTTITSGGIATYSLGATSSGATINTTTGELSFSENTLTSQRSLGTVTVSVTLNGETGTATAAAYQQGEPIPDPDTNVECLDYIDNVSFRSVEKGPFAEEGEPLTAHINSSSGGHLYIFDISGYSKVDITSSSLPALQHCAAFLSQDTLYNLAELKRNYSDEQLTSVIVQFPWGCTASEESSGVFEGEKGGLYINGEYVSETNTSLDVSNISTNGRKYLYVVKSYYGEASINMPKVYAHN